MVSRELKPKHITWVLMMYITVAVEFKKQNTVTTICLPMHGLLCPKSISKNKRQAKCRQGATILS